MINASPREIAFNRVRFVFRRPEQGIRLTDRFDIELKAAPPNDFRLNEFDQLLEDVNEMKAASVAVDSRIVTVDDFCGLAEKFAQAQPHRWAALLRQWNKEERVSAAPAWRRALWRWIGV